LTEYFAEQFDTKLKKLIQLVLTFKIIFTGQSNLEDK